MRLPRHLLGGLACLLFCALPLRAADPSPLRLIPAEADLLFEINNLRQLHDLLLNLDFNKELQKFPATQEFFRSTQARRFFQLLSYYEKELGQKYPDLLENLTGGGIALGVKFGPNPPPALLVVQGKDEQLTQKSFKIILNVIEQELQRQEAKERLEKITYQGVEVTRIGKDLHLAAVGSVILVSSAEIAMHKGLDLYQGREKKSIAQSAAVAEAAKLLPKDVLARVYLNMETVRLAPGAKDAYKTPREIAASIAFGTYLDLLGRTPFVCAGLQATPDGFLATIRVPSGREGMGPELALHMPTDPAVPGSRPLLEPKGVLYSDSAYLDLGRIWEDRAKLFVADQVKAMEQFDKNSGRIPLAGIQLNKLLTEAGAYHRFVVANQPKVGYKITPKTSIPAFAFVLEMQKPESFGKSLEAVLRGVAFLNSTQVRLKMSEEKYKDCNLVGYRFVEDAPLKQDVNDIRFNFSPSFVRVGNQFVVCSTLELARELIDMLQKESQHPGKAVAATSRTRIYSAGVAEILRAFEDQLITQAVLDQAIPATEARAQVKSFLSLLSKQGELHADITYGARESHWDISVQRKK